MPTKISRGCDGGHHPGQKRSISTFKSFEAHPQELKAYERPMKPGRLEMAAIGVSGWSSQRARKQAACHRLGGLEAQAHR